MNVTLTCKDLHILIERPFALAEHPALEYKVENYSLQMDISQLLNGGLDLAQQILKKVAEAHLPMDEETQARREAGYKDFLDGLQRKHNVNPDADVPQ